MVVARHRVQARTQLVGLTFVGYNRDFWKSPPMVSDSLPSLELARQELVELRRDLAREQVTRQALEAQVAALTRPVGTSSQLVHAIGNVLTSVHVSATILSEQLQRSELEHFDQLARVLAAHQHDWEAFVATDPQGCHLPAYLRQSVEALIAERRALVQELGTLALGIDRLKGLLVPEGGRTDAPRNGPGPQPPIPWNPS